MREIETHTKKKKNTIYCEERREIEREENNSKIKHNNNKIPNGQMVNTNDRNICDYNAKFAVLCVES